MTPHRLLILTGLLLAAGLAFAQPPDITASMALVARGEYDAAVLALYPLSRQYPEDGLVHYWLGRAYYEQRHYRLATRARGVTVARDGQHREALLWHARALRASGETERAKEAYAAYRGLYPGDASMLLEYAETRARTGDLGGALETVRLLNQCETTPAVSRMAREWQSLLDGAASLSRFEPAARYDTAHFQVRFDPEEMQILRIAGAIEEARRAVSEECGLPITGFRVLLFSSWEDYRRYARLWLEDDRDVYAPAFTLPGLLVLWSPERWRGGKTGADPMSTLRHEMVHLAISARTGDQGIPLWLNEGLACHFGGFAGIRTGHPPVTPLSLRALDHSFADGSRERQEQAYAQAHAMAAVLVSKLGRDGVLRLLDLLAEGIPLSVAYQQLSREAFADYLSSWPLRFAALPKGQ